MAKGDMKERHQALIDECVGPLPEADVVVNGLHHDLAILMDRNNRLLAAILEKLHG